MMRLVLCGGLAMAAVFAADKNTRTIPDVTVSTPAGPIRGTQLRIKKGGAFRPTRLTGVLVNETGKAWDLVGIRVQPSDGRGTAFTKPPPFVLYSLKAGGSSDFYFDLSGKNDFETLAYEISYTYGFYKAKYQFQLIAPTPNNLLQFSDELTEWSFLPQEKSLRLELVNKSDKSIKLDWNQVSYVDATGKAHKVALSTTRYMEVNSIKPPTMIPPGARAQDSFYPTDHINYTSTPGPTRGWTHAPIFPNCPSCRELKGSEFRIFVPLDIGGAQKEYTFRVKVAEVE